MAVPDPPIRGASPAHHEECEVMVGGKVVRAIFVPYRRSRHISPGASSAGSTEDQDNSKNMNSFSLLGGC